MEQTGRLNPSLLHACECGEELQDQLKTKGMICRSCNGSLSEDQRLEIELLSKTFMEIAAEKEIEGIQLNSGEPIEIDEAALPTGLLPLIVDRAAQTSFQVSQEKHFRFHIKEYEEPAHFAATHLFVRRNPESEMELQEALPIFSHTISRLIEMSRQEDPTNPYINDLRLMTVTELADGFEKPAA